jgi:hypothetical protein
VTVERRKKRTTFLQRAQTVEAHGVEPLKDILFFPMLRSAAVLLNKPLYLLESGNDAFRARGPPALLFRLREVVECSAKSSSSARKSSRSMSLIAPLILEAHKSGGEQAKD